MDSDSAGVREAIVVGAGPKRLAAAIALAREGLSVRVLGAQPGIGGATGTEGLTRPAVRHDVCAAILRLARLLPYLRRFPLRQHGRLVLSDPQLPAAVTVADLGVWSAVGQKARRRFRTERARAADAYLASHAVTPLTDVRRR